VGSNRRLQATSRWVLPTWREEISFVQQITVLRALSRDTVVSSTLYCNCVMKSELSYATCKLQFIIASTERDIKNGTVRLSARLCRLRCSFNVADTSSKATWSCLTWLSEQMWRRKRRVYSEGAGTVGRGPLSLVAVPTVAAAPSAATVDRSARTAGPRTLSQQHVLSKRRKLLAHRHGVICRKTWSEASATPLWEPTIYGICHHHQ